MAGTIPISMTQQFTSQGVPLVGGKLYIFQTGTLAPQSAYTDSGLTNALPNPMTLDSSGRIPQFFLADGTIKARLTDSSGATQAEWDNLLVIGPSGGSGGGGATVDPTAIFQTGDVMWLDQSGVRSGWVRDNGRTIGSATSGAAERANSDCQALFTFVWNTFSDTLCPVIGGRGGNAAADWSANKQITLPDKRGRSAFGLADMGSTDSGRLTGVPFTTGNATTPGSLGGESAHTLADTEVPATALTISSYTPGTIPLDQSSIVRAGNSGDNLQGGSVGHGPIQPTVTLPDFHPTGTVNGGGGGHNNMPLFTLGTFYRKL